MVKKFYITTAIDYVNAEPHIGHAYQKIIADVLARRNKLLGNDVLFLTGTDEHGQKLAKSALEAKKSPQEFVEEISKKFETAWKTLNIDYDIFMRTTKKSHKINVQEIIMALEKKGDIYKGIYDGLYCEGCEAYVTEKSLVEGYCPYHPGKKLEKLKEEAYFFRLSKYQKKILDLYKKNKNYILPIKRRKEFVNRVKEGLNDLNISRKNVLWGIPFPLDKGYVTYVWFEALLSYITAIDYPENKFKKYWPADVQVLGIDNGWFHCVIWPAMLFAIGIQPAKTILINGFLTFNGKKIGKSLGNTISPINLVEKYGVDSIRYYVCRNFVFGQDGDFLEQELIDRHNNELADKLGNLISRVSALIEKNGIEKCTPLGVPQTAELGGNKLLNKLNINKIEELFDNYEFDKVLNEIFGFIDICNEYVQSKKPWETKDKKVLYELADSIKTIGILLYPFIPSTSEKISKHFGFKIDFSEIEKSLDIQKVSKKKIEVLFKKI